MLWEYVIAEASPLAIATLRGPLGILARLSRAR
jgi:hypothetical protein